MSYDPAPDRYDRMPYRRCGRSGLKLPVISLGLWQNFGDERPAEETEAILTRAFDLGVTHFDLANNYGPPYGSAETNAGVVLGGTLAPHRDELVIATKAGYDMWPGPYGDGGSRKYLLGSLEASLKRLQLEYVDIFYSHRFDPETPLEETMGALDTAVRQGKARYVGISSYPPEQTEAAVDILAQLGTPLLIHQPAYSCSTAGSKPDFWRCSGFGRWGASPSWPSSRACSPTATWKGVPAGSRASRSDTLPQEQVTDAVIDKVRALQEVAARRNQTMAQMALAWTLRDERITSTLIGVSSLAQLEQNVATIENLAFSPDELSEIDKVLSAR